MSNLYQRLHLTCPYNRAQDLLAKALAKSVGTGAPQTLRLTVPLPNAKSVDFGKEVAVTFGTAVDPMHFDHPWSVHWHPNDGGLYPDFDGTLTVRADETYSACFLELRGSYQPPLGVAGVMFDAVLGTRIASSTARELLRKIGHDIEDEYRATELAKHPQATTGG